MAICKRNFDENRCIYFSIKEEKVFIKYVEILENVGNIIKKKFNSELMIVKNILKLEKNNKHKRRLSIFLRTNNVD